MRLLFLLPFLAASPLALAADQGPDWTTRHEAGRCALRGHCGKQGFFGSDLPCPDNGRAAEPNRAVREKLVKVCGEKWAEGPVCCLEEQIDVLETNLKRADQIIAACPACEANFFNLFCTFTCSPDQSLFLNVTKVTPKGDKYLVTELDNLVSSDYGAGFYDSCKDVKFGAGMRAMDLIGGGAKNYSRFLTFLGEKKFGGSPFQMNFPDPKKEEFPGMEAMDDMPKRCDDPDERYRCACVDCPATCPKLREVSEARSCHVGALPCLSFAVIIIYSVFVLLLIIAISGHVAYQSHSKAKNERLQLLQDTAPSDDEDEGDVIHAVGMMDRPQREYYLNTVCDRLFHRLGYLCAEFPAVTITSSVLVVALLSLGWINFSIETNPVRLWVSPDSSAAQEKAFFDTNFGPFYRSEQAFLVNDTDPLGPGPVLSYDTLRWWFDVESRVQRIISFKTGVMLDDICFKPVEDACVVQSVTGYFGGSFANVDPRRWRQQLQKCTDSPVDCLPQFQQPLDPKMILGGYNESILDAKSLVVTWVVNNHPEGSPKLEDTMDWEQSLKNLLLAVQAEARDRGLRLSFNTEISLEEELNKSTNTDAKIVVISYIIMFIYASLALGSTTLTVRTILRYPADALVQSKFMLGIMGIVIVLMSVSASVGLFSACGVKVTLIIAEVIPFLVLAIGVDNIFLIVHEFERVNVNYSEAPIPERIGRAMGRIGPSILLSATTETVAFALGAAVGMPAVRNFAAYAAGAVLLNALLQITLFVSVLALNQRRVEDGRADCFPCLKVRSSDSDVGSMHVSYGVDDEGGLEKFIRKHYAPALLGKKTKVAIITLFLGIFTIGAALIPKVELGLDQRIAIPSDSYLINYFNDLYDYFDVGPPVYFVAKEMNVTERMQQQELCGHFTTCQSFSLSNIIEQESKRSDVSYISSSAAVWVDDFFQWLDPSFEACCTDGRDTCFAQREPPWNRTLWGMPEGKEFVHFLDRWLKAPTTAECPLAGQAAYGNAIVVDHDRLTIPTSNFRTSHTPLKSQSDFIHAYSSARRIASEISEHTSATVFPYSSFYIFFDQYLSIVRLAGALLGAALAIIFALTTLFLGSLATGSIVTLTVTMILVDILGFMALAGVSLNAVSLVNLVISVGIGVEFCAHIARAFAFPSVAVMERAPRHRFRGRDVLAWSALVNVGASVFTGITVTKFLGVCVLAFTRSKIFEIYYFRIWVALVVFAAAHALVFLPVILSLFGGEGYVDPESDGGLERDLRSRTYPSLLQDDGYDSDDL